MFDDALQQYANELLGACRRKGVKMVTAESCTGGLIAALMTEIAGSSDVFERGYVTYSNQSKTDMLGIDAKIIEKHGAVNEEVVTAMVQNALSRAKADIAVAITGIAGPGGGLPDKPVGLVYIAVATNTNIAVSKSQFSGSRDEIRRATVMKALSMMDDAVSYSFANAA